jgi:hypothetical protein
MIDPHASGGAVESHQPLPASQQVSSGSSGGRRSDRAGGSNLDLRSATVNFFASSLFGVGSDSQSRG